MNVTLAQILFSVLLICEIGGNNYKILFYVLPSLEKDLILGINFMKAFGVIIDFVSRIVTIAQRLSGDNINKANLRTMGIGIIMVINYIVLDNLYTAILISCIIFLIQCNNCFFTLLFR